MVSQNPKVAVFFASGVLRPEILEILEAIPSLNIINQAIDPESFFDSLHLIPDLVLIELNEEIATPEWLEKFTRRLSPGATIMCAPYWQPDFLIQATQAGFREFLTLPFSRTDLEDVIKRICLLRNANQTELGHVIVVTGYKGGVGVTTIAINLAMALGELINNKVALVDLGRPFPDIAKFLDQEVTYSLSDIIEQGGSVDVSFLQKIMQPYGPKLDILNGCNEIMDQSALETDFVEHIFNSLRHMYHYIVVDLGHGFDPLFIEVIKQGDMVIMLSGLTIADLKNLKTIWPLLTEWAGGSDKLKVVVNRLNKGNSIQLESLENITHSPPFESLPSDYHLLMDALIQGTPLGIAAPRSKLWDEIKILANKVRQQLEIVSEEAGDEVSEIASQGQHWFWPKAHRGTILGAFFLATLLLIILILNSLVGGPRQAPVIQDTKSIEKKAVPATGSPKVKEGPPAPEVQSPNPSPALSPEKSTLTKLDSLANNLTAGPPPEAQSSSPGIAPSPEAEGEPRYVGSITSNKYHYPDCQWAKTILPERLIGFKSVAEAKKKGYLPCPTCKPPRED
jgi:pilus assembly protein CpaE